MVEPPSKKPRGLTNTQYAAWGLSQLNAASLSKEEANEVADVVVGIWEGIPEKDKDGSIVATILDAAEAAQPEKRGAGGARRRQRGGDVLTRSQAALRQTAKTGLKVLTATGGAVDETIATVIEKLPLVVVGGVVVNGGFTVFVNAVRDILSNAPPPPEWQTFLRDCGESIKSVGELGADILPWAQSPAGVMAIASFIMRSRAAKAEMSVWDLIKSDALTVVSEGAVAGQLVGQALQREYYSALSAYAKTTLEGKEADRSAFMSKINHLKPSNLALELAGAETLASIKLGRGRRLKTKKLRRKSRRVTRRRV